MSKLSLDLTHARSIYVPYTPAHAYMTVLCISLDLLATCKRHARVRQTKVAGVNEVLDKIMQQIIIILLCLALAVVNTIIT